MILVKIFFGVLLGCFCLGVICSDSEEGFVLLLPAVLFSITYYLLLNKTFGALCFVLSVLKILYVFVTEYVIEDIKFRYKVTIKHIIELVNDLGYELSDETIAFLSDCAERNVFKKDFFRYFNKISKILQAYKNLKDEDLEMAEICDYQLRQIIENLEVKVSEFAIKTDNVIQQKRFDNFQNRCKELLKQ